MTFPKFPAVAFATGFAVLASCASSTPKKDPYAEAAASKRALIDQLSRRIDSLRLLPETPLLVQQIDSLRVRRSFEVGNLQSIGKAADQNSVAKENSGAWLLHPVIDSNENKKYPIQKPGSR